MTTRDEIRKWLVAARKEGATHVIVARDRFDGPNGNYPIKVLPGTDVFEECDLIRASDDDLVEVYWIESRADLERQIQMGRCFNYGPYKRKSREN